MVICEALHIEPEYLLMGKTYDTNAPKPGRVSDYSIESEIVQVCENLDVDQKKRLLAYANMLVNTKN